MLLIAAELKQISNPAGSTRTDDISNALGIPSRPLPSPADHSQLQIVNF
jgi:hypothetical protein